MMALKKIIPPVLIAFLFLSCGENSRFSGEIPARQGRVHISQSMLDNSPVLELTGEVGFYWNQFIDPQSPPPMTEYTPVNEDWGGLYPEQGDASLRVIIDKDPMIDKLAISINSVYSSYKMYVNGTLVSSSGRPSLSEGRRQIKINRQEIIYLDTPNGPADIVFHISNPYYHRNGIKGFQIGRPDDIFEEYYWALFFDCLNLGILLALTLYHFVLTFSKINRTYILYFALLTLTICFRYFIVSTKLMCDVFPGMNLMAYDRLQRLGIYPIAGFFISYLYHMFPRISHRIPVRIIQILTILFSILSFLVPPKAVSGVLFTAFYPVFLFVIVYGLYIIARAVLNKENDALPMAAGVIILVLTAVFDMLIDRDVFPAYNTYQMNKGMIVFIFIQAFIISKRLNRAYTNEKRFREALQGVQSRLELTIEGAKLGLVEWDILHNTWYLNDNFSQMIGFKKDHLIFSRRHWLELIHPEDLKEIDSLLKGAITGKIGNFRCEYRLRMSGGSYRWCLLLGKVLQQNRLGGAEWFVGLHIDISDRKD